MPQQHFVTEGQKQKYPWAEMEVRDWFVTKKDQRSRASKANRTYSPKCFAQHKQKDGNYRVERIA